MPTKIRSANYYKTNCVIPKGFEKATTNTKTDFQKTSLYEFILKSNPYSIKEKADNLIATGYFIYYKKSVENTISEEIKEVLNRVKSKNTFKIKIDTELKKFVEGVNKMSGLNEVLNITISNNQMLISYQNKDLGISSEFYQDIENTKNIKFSIITDYFHALLKNCGIGDTVSFDCCDGLICASVIKKGSLDFDWTVLISVCSFKELTETKNQIILREKFELRLLENPIENLPKIEKIEKQEIKINNLKIDINNLENMIKKPSGIFNNKSTLKYLEVKLLDKKKELEILDKEPKTSAGGFYILVEYNELDGKKYNYFTSQKFENRELAKNFLTEARSSEKAMAIAIKIVSQKEAEQKISQAKKDKNIINYKWEII